MHRIATDPDYANKVLTKNRSPKFGIRFTASTLANLGSQDWVRNDVSKDQQRDSSKDGEGIE